MPNLREVARVLEEAKTFVLLEGNDFSWSGWNNRDDALVEINAVLDEVNVGSMPIFARVLFLPTGPLQELSLSSGWGDGFIRLANWFDEAESGVDCHCYEAPMSEQGRHIGTDDRYGDVFVANCEKCGAQWLRYVYEFEAETGSGRWFLGVLPRLTETEVTASNALGVLSQMPWYFRGGSYYGIVSRGSGEIVL